MEDMGAKQSVINELKTKANRLYQPAAMNYVNTPVITPIGFPFQSGGLEERFRCPLRQASIKRERHLTCAQRQVTDGMYT